MATDLIFSAKLTNPARTVADFQTSAPQSLRQWFGAGFDIADADMTNPAVQVSWLLKYQRGGQWITLQGGTFSGVADIEPASKPAFEITHDLIPGEPLRISYSKTAGFSCDVKIWTCDDPSEGQAWRTL